MKHLESTALTTLALLAGTAAAQPQYAWRYYRPSNTGIQGDYCDAIHIGADGNPWIGGYDPGFEEGGIARFIRSENRWENISNVDFPIIGHPENTGTARVSDIVADASGRLWMATGRGALRFDPAVGPSSLARYGEDNSPLPGGWCEDVDIAPDGTIWFASRSTFWGFGGINRFNPSTGTWASWPEEFELMSVQPRASGGYLVWASTGNNGLVRVFDSLTNIWTTPPYSGQSGEIAALPGKDCTDDGGNFWAIRATTPGQFHRLAYQNLGGTWVTPPEPYEGFGQSVWAFRATTDRRALLVDGGSRVWYFNGTAWEDKGVWREGAFSSAVNMDAAGNIWASGVGGAARRDAQTGQWQRYRITNTSQYDFFSNDLTVAPDGTMYACANAGPGYGGMVKFDGSRWTGFNEAQYGLGHPWPFPTDNSSAVHLTPASGRVVVNPMFNGTHTYNGVQWHALDGGPSTTVAYTEDSLGRLWQLGEYMSLGHYEPNGSFSSYPIASWGQKLARDPDAPGTVWAQAGYEIVKTDGSTIFSRTIDDFPELNSQSDTFTGLAIDHGGIAWVGSWTQYTTAGSALIRIDSNTGTYESLVRDEGWPFPADHVRPAAVTPDGRVWMLYDSEYPSEDAGLLWWDGTNVGTFPAPPGGAPQWGGLPHASVKDVEVRLIPGGYELWMSCLSRGIAVLKVTGTLCPADFDASGFVDTDDFDAFVLAFEAGSPIADFDATGFVDTDDFDAFVQAFESGC